MKLWEAIKALTDDPTKVFEGNLGSEDWVFRMRVEKGVSRYFHFEVLDGGKVIYQSLPAGGFNGNIALDLDWHLVRNEV